MAWIQEHNKMVSWIYEQNKNSTFALRFGDNLEISKYASISDGPFNDTKNYYDTNFAEPYNIVCRIRVRKEPSADFAEDLSIAYDPSKNTAYLKKGVGRFEKLHGINTNPLAVEYKSDRQLVAECDECGSKTEIPLEDRISMSDGMEKNESGETVTPCCFSANWTTKLD